MRIRSYMGRAAVLVAGIVLASTAGAQTSAPAAAPAKPAATAKSAKPVAKKPAIEKFKLILEPRAMDLLKATSAKLAAAKTMSFTAVVGYEYPSKLGPPIVYSTRYDVTMQRPDKLRILIPGDGPASEYYYDGKTATAYAPVENLAAVADAPPTIDEALEVAYKKAAIFFPFEDLLVADPYAAMTEGAILAYYIGPSNVVGGVKTDMVAWANNDVHLQIWIGAEDKLPRRIRAMYRADPLALRHEVVFSNWQIDQPVAPDTFVSEKAKTAGRMAFAAPAPPPKGVKPLTMKSKSPAPAKAPAKTN
ncbi:MAG TPA: DUF2092 domain-containing protein [Casimicrobiaceae bacterium]